MGQGKKTAFSQAQVLEAIRGSKGLMTRVATALKVTSPTAKKWVNKWPVTQQEFEAESNDILDTALDIVYRKIEEGNLETAKWLITLKANLMAKRLDGTGVGSSTDGPIERKQQYRLGDGQVIVFPE